MAVRAVQLWKEHEKRWSRQLLHQTGVLWMAAAGDDQFELGSLPMLRDAGMAYEELCIDDMARRWPQINLEGVRWGIYEPDGGFLEARARCGAGVEGVVAAGGGAERTAVVGPNLVPGRREDDSGRESARFVRAPACMSRR